MIRCSASRHILLLAGTIGTLAVAVCPAAAQQTPAAPEAPPPWAQGRPEAALGAKLAPIVPPPLPTAVDKLPTEKLKAPKGFKIEVYASLRLSGWSTPQAERSMAISPVATGHQDFEIVVPGDLRGMWITATYNVTHFFGLARGNPRGPGAETHRELFPGDTSELSNAVTVQ